MKQWLLVILIVAALTACSRAEPQAPAPTCPPCPTCPPQTEPEIVEKIVKETVIVEVTRVVMVEPPTATPEPTPSVGTRSQPVPAGEPFTITDHRGEYRVTVLGTVRDQEASAILNPPGSFMQYGAKEGLELYMAQIKVEHLSGSDEGAGFDEGDWQIDVNNELKGYTIASYDDALQAVIYPGGETTGYVLFQIPAGAQPDRLRFSPSLMGDAYWFALP